MLELFANSNILWAQVAHGPFWGYSVGEVLIGIVVLLVLAGILYIVLQNSKIPIPPYMYQIAGLVLLAVVAIFAIKLVLSL